MALPNDRPPTKAECWEHWKEYFGPEKDRKWLIGFARKWWVESYVVAVNLRQWDKQPDWRPGDPVIPEAVGTVEMFRDQRHRWGDLVDALYQRAQAQKAAA